MLHKYCSHSHIEQETMLAATRATQGTIEVTPVVEEESEIFGIDDAGNKFIRKELSNGRTNIRVREVVSNPFSVFCDMMALMMVYFGINRKAAEMRWERLEDDDKKSVQADLKADEGMLYFKVYCFVITTSLW